MTADATRVPPRYGITIPFDDAPLRAQRDRYRRLVDLGFTDVWSSEADGHDAVTPLAVAAAWAPELRIATAIIPAFTRGPAVVAQTAAALAECAPAGFVCGIGASSSAIVEGWNGIAFDRPIQRIRDLAQFLRLAFTGQKVTEEYATFHVRGFRLARPPKVNVPVIVAGLQPTMLRIAGRDADGCVVNWFSAEDIPKAVAEVHRDANTKKEIAARILVAPTTDADRVRSFARRLVTAYLTAPAYAASQRWLGRGPHLEPMERAWRMGDRRRALELVPDRIIDSLVVHGAPGYCRDRIHEYIDNGATTPVVALLPMGYDLDEAITAVAPLR